MVREIKMLSKEEYVEQTFFFRTFQERLREGYSSQEILYGMKNSILNTTDLSMAVGILYTEIKHSGKMSLAMKLVPHYFSAFQTFVMQEAEREEGRLDFRIALEILEREAEYRSRNPTPQGTFFYQFEVLCRNRLGYDYGLDAISKDPIFDESWRRWINVILRRQVGIIDIADLVYVRSEFYEHTEEELDEAVLFGEREGRIARASRRRDPSFLFEALCRHLDYPQVPRPEKVHKAEDLVPALERRIEMLEHKLQILTEELHGGINLEKYYVKKNK